jgi:hypothetical protein
VLLLNLMGVGEGLEFRPQVALSFHIVTAPAAWALGRAPRIPMLVNLHGDGVRARRHLTRFALADALDRRR